MLTYSIGHRNVAGSESVPDSAHTAEQADAAANGGSPDLLRRPDQAAEAAVAVEACFGHALTVEVDGKPIHGASPPQQGDYTRLAFRSDERGKFSLDISLRRGKCSMTVEPLHVLEVDLILAAATARLAERIGSTRVPCADEADVQDVLRQCNATWERLRSEAPAGACSPGIRASSSSAVGITGGFELDREVAVVVGARLGAGAEGVVHLAHLSQTGEPVVVKVFKDARAHARALDIHGRISPHPNLMKCYGVARVTGESSSVQAGGIPDRRSLVFEYCSGMTVADFIKIGRSLHRLGLDADEWESCRQFGALQLFSAVAHLNEHCGIAHNDIKPENILIDSEGRLKLIDFGLATRLGTADAGSGTPGFIAPERIRRGHSAATKSADCYSAANVLALWGTGAMVTRSLDGLTDNDRELAAPSKLMNQLFEARGNAGSFPSAQLKGQVASLRGARIGASPFLNVEATPLDGIIEGMLIAEPESRPSARETLDALHVQSKLPGTGDLLRKIFSDEFKEAVRRLDQLESKYP